jgi:pyruvate dehydrogenase E2 component (dihydrolipoamide acetyltransferase)
MPTEVKLPELGENVEKGDVLRVLVAEGDEIEVDQPVLELETDKATIEVPSSAAGRVTGIKVKAGDKVKVGQVVLTLDDGAAGAKANGKPAEAKPAATEARPPAAEQAKVSSERGQKPADEGAENAAKSGDGPAPIEGARPGPRPAPVVDITSARSVSTAEAMSAARIELTGRGERAPDPATTVPAAPSVRRYARELGVEIEQVAGSGPGGRIGQDDVKAHAKSLLTGGARARGGAVPAGLPDLAKFGPVESKPMSGIRRKTAEHLSTAWQAPHVTQHDKADVTALEEFRKLYAARVEQAGGKLTVTAVAIKIVAAAIGRYPQFASSIDLANDAIVYRQYCHIGVAVDTPGGLLVPVIRDADRKTITEIAVELATLSKKARDRKLSLDEMSGSVLSVTNLGGLGGTAFTPIVNYPEVAILGLSRTAMEPVYRDGQFVPRPMLPLSLSYDHRVIDGADAVRFLRFVVDAIEQPLSVHL